MELIHDNSLTEYVYGSLFCYDFDTEAFPGKEYLETLDSTSTFAEYVYSHAKRCGYTGSAANIDGLIAFVVHQCKLDGIQIGSGTAETLKRWFRNGVPSGGKGTRENMYRLCFALKMDAQQAAEFFLKAYLERPFNYKDIREAVYFFCFRKGLRYADAQRIIDHIEAITLVENPCADNITEAIGVRLHEIETEEELICYLADNRSGFSTQNQTATALIEELVKSCIEIAPMEYAASYDINAKINVSNVDELLGAIYGYYARATEDGQKVLKQSISKSKFPALIKQNWPQREQFQQILHKGTASYDVIRRALIMLTFYDFAANATVNHALEDGIFDEFTDEMNRVLSACGYIQLYWRNPFDWMIGYCAMSPNPLDTLRDLIEEYYLSVPSVMKQPQD